MKNIKGSLSKPHPSSLIAIAALSLCALLPLRVYQATTIIDPETGFFTKSSFTIPLFYIVGGIVVLALMALSYLNNKANRTRNCAVKSKALGAVSVLTSLSVMYDAVASAADFMKLSNEYSVVLHKVNFTTYLTQSGATAQILEAVFGLITGVFFCVYAASCFTDKIKLSSVRLLSAAPVAWAICRIVYRFIEKISFVNVSDLLLELIMLVFMIMFMLAFAQVVTGVTPEISAWRLYGCGLPTAITAFIVSVPKVFLAVIGHSELIVEGYGFELCDLMLAIFIPVFLYHTATVKSAE
jgi:hypothetical protein